MKKKIKMVSLVLFTIFVLPVFSLLVSAQQVDTLKVIIDMRTPIKMGWLDTATEIVGLRGDHLPLSWGTTFPAKDPEGNEIYKASIPFTRIKDSMMLAFKIKVDGINNPEDGWQKGKNHSVTVYAGKKNSILLKWEDLAKEAASTITGNVKVIKDFNSAPLENRDLYIYLPPGYEKGNKRYPVLYLHDGQNIFDAAATGQEWKMDETAQSLIKRHNIEPIIIVGMGNTKNRIDEYTPTRQIWNKDLHRLSPPANKGVLGMYTGLFATDNGDSLKLRSVKDTIFAMLPGYNFWQLLIKKTNGVYYLPGAGITFHFHENQGKPVQKITADKPPMGGKGKIYSDLILNRIKPFIDKNFRTKPGARWTSLGGSSLGGLITLYTGLKHPDKFSGLLVVSPSVWWDNRWIINMVKKLKAPTNQKIWLDIGTGEGKQAVVNVRELKKALHEKGWRKNEIGYMEAEGAVHNERAWAERVPDMLRFLFSNNTE